MKKLLVVLGLAMAALSFQASAATIDLGNITTAETFGGVFKGKGPFSQTFTFTVPNNQGIGASITNAAIQVGAAIKGQIANFAATLDGQAMTLSSTGLFQLLMKDLPGSIAGSHTIVVTGTSAGSFGGSVVAQTPIPAAVWLFGSAIMGLMGMSRRKSA